MTLKEAYEALTAAGLIARLGRDMLFGGGYRDRSGPVNTVEDSYVISTAEGGQYCVYVRRSISEPADMVGSLQEAVAYVLREVKPGKDIPPDPPLRGGGGYQPY